MQLLFQTSVFLALASALVSAESPPVLPQICANVYDDPHTQTFDGLKYDCQGDGDFILSKSLDSGFELQGRFYKENWDSGLVGTTTTAAVLKTGAAGEPLLEASYDRQCNLEYYLDKTKVDLEGTHTTGIDKVSFYKEGKERYFVFADSGVSLHLTLRNNHHFGCFLNVKLCIPDAVANENIVGILGSPDGKTKNDFMDRDGTDLKTVGKIYWGEIHDYCTSTWCIHSVSDSLFVNPGSTDHCDAPYDDSTEKAVEECPQEIKDACNNERACIIDAIVSGDITTGQETGNNERRINEEEKIDDCSDFAIAADVCALPDNANEFSVVTFEDAHIGAHSMYYGLAIGGTLYDSTSSEDGTIDRTQSYIKDLAEPNSFSFNFGAPQLGSSCMSDSFEGRMQYIAQTAQDMNENGHVVKVFTEAGPNKPYTLYDLRPGGQDYDKGMTLAIFNTADDVYIKATNDGRKFGPTIIAPFSKVIVQDGSGFVDGSIYAKSLEAKDGSLQLHGDTYKGPLKCAGSTPTSPKQPDDPPKTCKTDYEQCGGNGYTGETCCSSGLVCVKDSEWWSACKPGQPDTPKSPEEPEPESKPQPSPSPEPSCSKLHSQCGGKSWTGPTTCAQGSTCVYQSDDYSQCQPAPADPNCVAAWGKCGGVGFTGPTCCTGGYKCQYQSEHYSQCTTDPDPPCPAVEKTPDTQAPTEAPTDAPTKSPTVAPTDAPTSSPTKSPTDAPTERPTNAPTKAPTALPTAFPSKSPTDSPTAAKPGEPTGAPTVSPTKTPTTEAPTGTPTDAATSSPTNSPTKAPTVAPDTGDRNGPTDPPKKGSGSGDPHFKTWTGDKYDYHGECDLVLVDNPSFANGKGLRLHIRTTRVKYFSFIEKMALQIGNDVLEFDNDVENFLINGAPVEANRRYHKTMFGDYLVRRDRKAISVRLSNQKKGGPKIDFHTRKNGFPAVIVDGGHTDIFKGSLGLLGDWATGKKLARDGKTEIAVDPEDAATFALEWQVRDYEPQLFKEIRFPQFPTKCTPPKKMPSGRLGVSMARKEAEEACAHWKEDKEDCIFDVIATRDILVAEEGHIVHVE